MNPMLKLRGDAVARSQKAYIAQAAFEYFVAILVSDAFLAKLLTYMGFSDLFLIFIPAFHHSDDTAYQKYKENSGDF